MSRPYPQLTLLSVLITLLILSCYGCAFTRIKRSKEIAYSAASYQKLNVYAPRKNKALKPVLVHFYGGNWTSGRKGLYSFFGSRWARKGVVTVIPDYPKSPGAAYKEMTFRAAEAIKWTKENIAAYGGDPNNIFVSGHSAGGQLAALASIDTTYFRELGIANPVKGMILIDPAGLDMYRYMKEVDYGPNNSYLDIFGKDSSSWKNASAIFKLHKNMPSILLYTGGKTLPNISLGAQRFTNRAKDFNADITYKIVKGKKHIPMITQFFNTGNPLYKEVKTFMNKAR
jgi:acetyl esterase/lipase